MDILEMAGRILLGFVLGSVIGLEREVNEKKALGKNKAPTAILGLRSFSLTTVLGVIVGFIYLKFSTLALLIGSAFLALLLIFYYIDSRETKDHGLTTELAAIYSFVIGLLIATQVFPIQLILAVTIIVILFLSQKAKIKDVVEDVRRTELDAFVSYAILALVIMPFLPNQNYSISDFDALATFLKNVGVPVAKISQIDLVNPFKIWLVLVLVTGVDLISYIFAKLIGEKKSWLLTSAIGGFVSSTATTQSIAQKSKKVKQTDYLVAAAILANLSSFIQIAFLIGLLNGKFISSLGLILILMLAVSGVLVFFYLRKRQKGKVVEKEGLKPEVAIIDLSAALKFAGLYLTISILSRLGLALFGKSGFLAATGLGALIGLDAVMVNTAQLAGTKVALDLAILAFIIANAVNLAAKSIYSYIQGSRQFSLKFAFSMLLVIAATIIGYLI